MPISLILSVSLRELPIDHWVARGTELVSTTVCNLRSTPSHTTVHPARPPLVLQPSTFTEWHPKRTGRRENPARDAWVRCWTTCTSRVTKSDGPWKRRGPVIVGVWTGPCGSLSGLVGFLGLKKDLGRQGCQLDVKHSFFRSSCFKTELVTTDFRLFFQVDQGTGLKKDLA